MLVNHHLERLRKISLINKNNEGEYILVGEMLTVGIEHRFTCKT